MSRKIHRTTYLFTERTCRLREYHNRVVLYIFFDKSLQVRHLVNGRLGRLCSLSLQSGNRVTYDEIMWLWSWENSWVLEKSGTSHGQLHSHDPPIAQVWSRGMISEVSAVSSFNLSLSLRSNLWTTMNVFYSESLRKITDVHLPAAGKFDSRNKRKTDHVTSMRWNTSVTSSHINVKAGNLLRHAEDGRVTSSFQFLVFSIVFV